MSNATLKSILSATAFGIVAGLASASAAADGMEETFVHPDAAEVKTVRVQYLSTELATEEGRAALQRRIASAAREVCGPSSLHEAGSLKLATRNRECYRDSLAAANSQIESGQYAAASH